MGDREPMHAGSDDALEVAVIFPVVKVDFCLSLEPVPQLDIERRDPAKRTEAARPIGSDDG